jgi:hypothetical protein
MGRCAFGADTPLGVRDHMTEVYPTAMAAVLLVFASLFASTASGTVSAQVYLSDEQTPLPLADPNNPEVYRDIMVGTKLTIFISSDTAESWGGQLWLSNQNLIRGQVSGRDYVYDPVRYLRNYVGSCLPGAGPIALVTRTRAMEGVYFDLTAAWGAVAGEWFVFDYEAVSAGTCSIGLYSDFLTDVPEDDRNPYEDEPPPLPATLLQVLRFNHVPSRDFSGDTIVNFADFAILADAWRTMTREDPNIPLVMDLNADDRIDVSDMALFSEYWLERTEATSASPDPDAADDTL